MLTIDPIRRFSLWLSSADRRSPGEWFDATAMTLATSGSTGEVSARMVLLKSYGPDGFTFYTNYASRKGKQLAENPRAALVFHWPHLRRQVRIEGTVGPMSPEDSTAYFRSRPRLSQLAASISNQSEVIPSREFLMDRFRQAQREQAGREVERPATWGGFRLVPWSIEFWQHRDNRLHDRVRYTRAPHSPWTVHRLAP